ncbi:redoxin family protein [Tundrisphaera sp. TA3]|uniref:redoxin family protein n=1 Tax=Tundrisphaera sp. TA3 TaxID=3435775 RepID=UPI003EB7CE27
MIATSERSRIWTLALGLTLLGLAGTMIAARAEETGRALPREVKGIDGRAIPLIAEPGGATAVIFYSTECPISNAYSVTFNAVADRFAGRPIRMVGVCVDPDLKADEVATHAREYGLKFPVAQDRDGSITRALGAKVTPEAALIDAEGAIRYQGRVDDQFAARGKRNATPATHELEDACLAVLENREVARPRVEAVGCPVPIPPRAEGVAKPTFTRDVAGILQRNCQQCHRPGQVGPFPLVTYEHARKRADDIVRVTSDRLMPPWKPAPGVGPAFKHSKALPESDIAILAAWAESGAPEGNSADMPTPPAYPEDWALGTPDLVLELPVDFEIPATGDDIYRCFVMPTNLPADTFISGIEYRPGNPKVVHHILSYVDVSGMARKKDAADEGPGYSCFSGPGVETHGDLGGWAPGNEPAILPAGIGRSLPRGADVVTQIHYHPSGKPETDRTRIGLYFSKVPVKQVLHWNAALNARMRVPAGAKNHEVDAGWTVPQMGWEMPVDVTALAVTPHMHMLGRDMTMTVTYPDGRNEDLIQIPDWDFNWQNTYYFEKPLDLPKGTVLKIRAHYDNSADAPANKNRPLKDVRWGEATTDEMCIGFLGVVKKGQDLTRPGEADDLGQIFRQQENDRRRAGEEAMKKAAAARKKAEAEKAARP